MSLLEARDLYKVYRGGADEVPAVKGVSLSLEIGEVALLMGPSGSGKTTLLSILGCILRPDSGTLRLCGDEVDWDDSAPLRRKYFGFVYQHYNLLSALNARENVMVPLELAGVRGSLAEEVADHALGVVALQSRARYDVAKLSGGEKQRVAIARAIVHDPPVVLADEPTGNLDSQNGVQVMTLLRDLATHRGKAVLVVTHDPRCEAFADTIYRMEDGEVRRQ
jgi:putative ABC transport system ATP-binding protein